jgi:hypothetical protein
MYNLELFTWVRSPYIWQTRKRANAPAIVNHRRMGHEFRFLLPFSLLPRPFSYKSFLFQSQSLHERLTGSCSKFEKSFRIYNHGTTWPLDDPNAILLSKHIRVFNNNTFFLAINFNRFIYINRYSIIRFILLTKINYCKENITY